MSTNSGKSKEWHFQVTFYLHMSCLARTSFCRVVSFHILSFHIYHFPDNLNLEQNDIITAVEAAFKSGAPFLSPKCGAVTIFIPTFKSFLVWSLSLSIRRCINHHVLCICRLCSFSSNCKYIWEGSKISPERLTPPL